MKPVIQTNVIKSARDHAVAQQVVNPQILLELLFKEMSRSEIIAMKLMYQKEEAKGTHEWTLKEICVFFELIDSDWQPLNWGKEASNSVHSI
jgi:hypothetical protein